MSKKNRLTKCVLIDDDAVALTLLENLVLKTPELFIVEKFEDAIQALHFLKNNPVDLIFLDIEMPGLGGFQLLNVLKNPPAVIIVTSNKDYALPAFDLKVADFLLKPVKDYSRFLRAVETVVNQIQVVSDHIFIKIDGAYTKVMFDAIKWIEADGDYVRIYLSGSDKNIMALSTMKALESRLPPHDFFRVHRSFIVNLKHIRSVGLTEVELEGKSIAISESGRSILIEKLNLL